MVKVSCPECRQPIALESEQNIGQQVICNSCHTQLEVTWLFPVSLDYTETSEPNPIFGDGPTSHLEVSDNKPG